MKVRKRILILVFPLLLLVCTVSGILYLRSERFQEHARATLISRMEKSTGLECRIDRLRLDLYRGRFVITGLTLSAKPGAPSLVSLSVREIRTSLSISSFWHLRLRLNELNILEPRLELVSGEEESSWNPEGILETLKISLRLEASKVAVRDGWVRVNGNTSPFQMSLHDLDCEVHYSKKLPSYRVRLKYGQSRVFWEGREILHGLEMAADVSLGGISVDSFTFSRGNSLFKGTGSFKDWNSPVLLIHADGSLDAADLILAHTSLNEGRGKFEVSADLRNDSHGVYSKGRFTTRAGGYRKLSFSNLEGTYEIERDVLHLSSITGRIADGNFLVNAEIQLREANKNPNRVLVITKNVPVVDAGRLLNLPLINFSNTADAKTVLTWYGGRELRADCDATLHGLDRPAAASEKSTLLDGKVKFTYLDSGTVDIETASLKSQYTSVQATGGRGSLFHVQLSTTRISEPFDLIAGFSPPVADLIKREADIREISGQFDFDGDVRVQSSSDIQYSGKIAVSNGRWRSYKVDRISTQAAFRSPDLVLRSLVVHDGPAIVGGDLDLKIAEDDRILGLAFKGKAHRVDLADLRSFGVDTSKMGGLLSGSGSVKFDGGSWEGEGQFSVENGRYAGEEFDGLHAQVSLQDQRLRFTRAEAGRGAARISAEGRVNLDSHQLDITTRLQGLSIEDLPAIRKKGLALRGLVAASGTLNGTVENPAFSGTFEVAGLQYESRKLGGGKGRIEFQKSTIHADARIQSDFGNLVANANISTRPGYPGKTVVEFKDLDVQKIVPAKTPPYLEDLSAALEGKLEAEGNFEELDSLRIRGEVDGAHFRVHEYEMHNDGRIRFTILNRNLRMESVRFVGEGTNLFLSGTIPFDDTPRLDLNLNGNLNLKLLEGIESKLHAAGTAGLDIRASGSKRDPQIIGQASLRDARLDYKDLPFRFSGMQGAIVFSRNLVRFENIRGSAASGTIELSGSLEHRNAVLNSINMGIVLRNARLPYPKDFKSIANAKLSLVGAGDVQILSGDVDVTRMEYVRSFDLLEQLASRSTASTSGPLTTEPYMLGLRLNIEIHSDNGLSIDNELTRMRGSMRLTLRGTPAYPSLTGRVEASEGTIFFRGSRFEISHASADFTDRNRINPVLEIRAEADVKTYRLILDAVGELDHLNLNITSDPPMSTVDILSLLTTGKAETSGGIASSATSQRESQMAGMSAASVLSQNLTGVIGKRVQRIFGLESFRVDPFLAGAENDPTARITISERLSKDLVVTFSRNLTTNQEQIVVIEYDVRRNLSVVATRDENGKFGLDFRFRHRLR